MKNGVFAVIFDLDGTLLNSSVVGLYRVKILCVIHKIKFDEEGLKKHWGLSVTKLLQKGLDIPFAMAEELHEQWALWDRAEPIPLVEGASGILAMNLMLGRLNFLLSSRRTISAVHALTHHRIRKQFADVVGIDGCRDQKAVANIYYEKPDPRALDPIVNYLAKVHGTARREVLYVGDTVQDVECGLGAGVRTVGVLTGMTTAGQFTQAGLPEENILPSVAYLERWIDEHRNGHDS